MTAVGIIIAAILLAPELSRIAKALEEIAAALRGGGE